MPRVSAWVIASALVGRPCGVEGIAGLMTSPYQNSVCAMFSGKAIEAFLEGADVGNHYDLRTYTDDDGETYYPYMFAKTLPHSETTGFPKKEDVDKVLKAVHCPTKANLDAIDLADTHVRKLEGLTTARNVNTMGGNPSSMVFPKTYPYDTPAGAFEMAEVYAQQLLRDVPFHTFDTDPVVKKVINALNYFTSKTSAPTVNGDITPGTLFRGCAPGEKAGPYISQFFYKSYNHGALPITQKYANEADATNMLSFAGWLAVQRGELPKNIPGGKLTYMATGRTLGSEVHRDPLYACYYAAAQIALQQGIGPDGLAHESTSSWTTGGPPDLFATVATVGLGALRTAWFQKWALGMRMRPEVFAQRYELARTDDDLAASVPGLAELKKQIDVADGLIDMVMEDNEERSGTKSAFLAVQYPEGSPTHPSLPAGHAVVAGACVTVLKAMLKTFDDADALKETKWVAGKRTAIHSKDGDHLNIYDEDDADDMTVNGELNKLASNVAIGRDWAGVHYRADSDGGLRAGEEYAITVLLDKTKEYYEMKGDMFKGWILQKFDGAIIKITKDGVQIISEAILGRV